jgi:D-arabinose 1-dehydrogenase-like Zn-dependent alcohol dehydrogenase
MGFRTVALSSSASKQSLAKELGAHDYLDSSKVNQAEELQKMGGAKLVVCTAPSTDAFKTLIDALAPRGTFLLLAVVPEIAFPARKLSS